MIGKFNSLVCQTQSLGPMFWGICCEQNHSSLKAAGRTCVFIKCYENVGTNDNSKSIASKWKKNSKINMLTVLMLVLLKYHFKMNNNYGNSSEWICIYTNYRSFHFSILKKFNCPNVLTLRYTHSMEWHSIDEIIDWY